MFKRGVVRARINPSARLGAYAVAGSARRLVLSRGFAQTLVSRQKKESNTAPSAPAAGAAFNIDETIDDYADVTATDEQIERNYREPPVQVTGKHGEYASTLYSSASVLNAVDAVERDLQWLQQATETIPSFQQFLSTGMPDKKIQRRLLQGVLKGAGFHRLTQKFVVTQLMEAGDLKLVPDIVNAYAQIMKAHRKEVPVVFTFASLPDKDFLARQIERVKKYRLEPDSTPQWEFKINPALIGGFTVEVGSNFKGNFSLALQFEHMRNQLKQAEEKWERTRPKDLQIDHFDTSKLFDIGISLGLADLDKPYAEVVGNKGVGLSPSLLQLTPRQAFIEEQAQFGLLPVEIEDYILSQTSEADLEKIKKVKELDLAQHEKHLMQIHNIAENDYEGKRKVKAKIEELRALKNSDMRLLGDVLKKHQPDTYKKYQSIFAH